jgi:1,4-dihydroxy-2-naphthoate octaprenyltransferase
MRVRALSYAVFQTSRPSQLLLIVGVYLLGATIGVAKGTSVAERALVFGVIPLLCISASVHYANEYADYETDALTNRTPFSGGSGALHETGLPRTIPLYAGIVTAALGVTATAVLWVTGWVPVPAVGLLAVIGLAGWQYSVGPLKLAWRGFGEVTNAALGGLVLPMYGGAVLDGPLLRVGLASIPFFLVVWLNLFATQWPDRAADRAVGKRTLAVQWPRRRLQSSYRTLAVLAGLSLAVLHPTFPGPDVLPTTVVLASLAVTPLVLWGGWGYTKREVPLPTVSAMVGLAVCQFAGWLFVL